MVIFGREHLTRVPKLVFVLAVRPAVDENVHNIEMTKVALRHQEFSSRALGKMATLTAQSSAVLPALSSRSRSAPADTAPATFCASPSLPMGAAVNAAVITV